jgi:Methyl-accepting chemotaxis protein (MCP) signalling domain
MNTLGGEAPGQDAALKGTSVAAGGGQASDLATPEHIAQLTQQLSTLLTETVEHIGGLNREARILALNAEIESARAGDAGVAFGVVAKAMSQLSEKTGDSAKELARGSRGLIREMQQVTDVLQTKMRGERLSDLALTNIDLVDRNLYERSCDVRWWATDGSVVAALASPTEENRRLTSQRLGVILNAYTVYFDLVLCDLTGKVVANGRPAQHAVTGMMQDQAPWFQAAMKTRSGDEFGFQAVHRSPLVNHQRSLVYSCGVRAGGESQGALLGVLGIVFNWDALGQTILDRMPLSAHEKQRAIACFVDAEGNVLADFPAGSLRDTFDNSLFQGLRQGQKGYGVHHFGGREYCAGFAMSPGFETYATGWSSLVMVSRDL